MFYFFNWLLKVTLLIMLLNSKNSNILYFFLFSIWSLVPILLFLISTLFQLLWRSRLLLLDWWLLLWLLMLVVYHFIHFIFVVLIGFLSLVSFITVRQRWVVKVSHTIIELATLHSWVILVWLIYQIWLTNEVWWCQKARLISININWLVSFEVYIRINFTKSFVVISWI